MDRSIPDNREITAVYKNEILAHLLQIGAIWERMVHNKGGKMLNRQVYVSDNEFIICPIADEDRDNYVELHRQINGEHTLFLNEHCKDMMWKQVLEGEDKVFSVFEINGDYCGSLELQNPDSDTPEIGIDLFENKRNKGIAPKVVKLLAKRCYKDRKVDYFLIRISSQNQHSKHVFEKWE